MDVFVATPPFESLRMMYCLCASRESKGQPYRLMAVDVKRAYFYAPACREIYIQMPMEDLQWGDEMNVAKLAKLGFVTRMAMPCIFVHGP